MTGFKPECLVMDIELKEIDNNRWMIPKTGNMRVPGIIFASRQLIKDLLKDQCLVQVANVATLPGIVKYSLAMPDIHWGYGFPIGGVAAFDMDGGIISPGGVGYDINCGCRLLTTSLRLDDIKPYIKELVSVLFKNIPTGVGSSGPIRLSHKEEARVAVEGASWAIKQGFGQIDDIERTEDNGALPGADPSILSERAIKRGHDQLGTLGSGNHFIEVQVVDHIYDEKTARIFNLLEGQITVFIHTGSRGFGHQICDDFLKEMSRDAHLKNLQLPDRQLAYAPLDSELAKRYLSAMTCAANFAWANRQILMHLASETFQSALSISPRDLGMRLLYDVCHNIAKKEIHSVDGREKMLCVHRKGATRSLPPGHPLLPKLFQKTGQPVLIPGDMGTYSYVLAGAQKSMELSFGSTCHGAGRVLSRSMAIKTAKGRSIYRELENKGIFVQSRGRETLAEEMPEAYKDINQVVDVVHESGLATKVARLRPLGVIKG
jgi:tRNA-splicing ligase RtcB (3'-phosphate/5'-hydroxy nucleic acid ligase)